MSLTNPAILLLALTAVSAFQAPSSLHLTRSSRFSSSPQISFTSLNVEGKKRRRKRKDSSTSSPVADPTVDSSQKAPPAPTQPKESAKDLAAKMLAQEQMMFDEEDLTDYTPVALSSDRINAAASKAGYNLDESVSSSAAGEQLNDIFDAGDFLAKKREKQLAEKENSEGSTLVATKKRIKRSDIEAYTRLLEMDPLADEDSRYFEEDNKVDFISALLGDVEPNLREVTDEENRTGKKIVKKTSFLGIGSGPLQLGHFFGALAIVLCAFVEYPGFPLTNLPDPLRGALQGGEYYSV